MKRIVSVSLGSSTRDHKVEIELLGETFVIERIGTDGSLDKYLELMRELDGKIDAFGLGGIDLYLRTRAKTYTIPQAVKMAATAKITPVVDGSGLKHTLERRVVRYLDKDLGMLRGKKAFMVMAVDRFGMADALEEAGCIVTFGDLMFALGIPIAIRNRKSFETVVKYLMPLALKLPYEMLYPTGSKQSEIVPKYTKFYKEADIIAGDFHYVRKHMPEDLKGKIIITNTVTSKNVEELAARGVSTLVTTTPELNGRSFGTNVMEATLIAASGKSPAEMTEADYDTMLDKLAFKPRVQKLN